MIRSKPDGYTLLIGSPGWPRALKFNSDVPRRTDPAGERPRLELGYLILACGAERDPRSGVGRPEAFRAFAVRFGDTSATLLRQVGLARREPSRARPAAHRGD